MVEDDEMAIRKPYVVNELWENPASLTHAVFANSYRPLVLPLPT